MGNNNSNFDYKREMRREIGLDSNQPDFDLQTNQNIIINENKNKKKSINYVRIYILYRIFSIIFQ